MKQNNKDKVINTAHLQDKINLPTRVLVIINTMDAGGAETFVMKVYRNIDRNKVQFDFLINKQEKCFYEEEITALGGVIYRGVSKSKNPVKSFIQIYRTVNNRKYSTVMCIAVHPLAAMDLIAAKLGGAKVRIVRSTNSSAGGGRLSDILAKVFRPIVNIVATLCLAPSTEAGLWLFGRKAVKTGKAKLITNGLEIDKYIFDEQKRAKKRQLLNIEEKFVVGHIGRFNKQKNHKFLLEVFKEVKALNPDAVLLLVGTGELRPKIVERAIELEILEDIIFAGVCTDIPDLLMAMDVMVFPSIYEGMPNVIIEAQATGLPCVVSDTITREVAITDVVSYQSINEKPSIWAQKILDTRHNRRRQGALNSILKAGYNIVGTANFIQQTIIQAEQ